MHQLLQQPWIRKAMAIEPLLGAYRELATERGTRPIFERALEYLDLRINLKTAEWKRIPREGPCIVAANHPFGLLEGIVLGAMLPQVRKDVKILANSMLRELFEGAEELRERFIFVDVFGGSNLSAVREAIEWLKGGGCLAMFPAGEVSHLNFRARRVIDPEWNTAVARLARRSRATVIPVFFRGANGPLFQTLGLVHPRLRTAMLVRELWSKRGSAIEMEIGTPIAPAKIAGVSDDRELTAFLRRRTYVLEHRERVPRRKHRDGAPIAGAVYPDWLEREIEPLDPLVVAGEFEVYAARASEIPAVLQEIGRLREITFREAGEGSGEEIDLDEFDEYYEHLFVWNARTREIVGAYRIARTEKVLETHGIRGLYTSTLFSYKREFLDALGPAAELGRSFVRLEYQKNYSALLLLWKGIGAWVARHPECRILFGPVSISNDYQPVSRQLMATYFQRARRSGGLAALVKARSPFKTRPLKNSGMLAWDIEELSGLISDIESDRKGLPVLLRQYLKLGGELLCFNVDARFSDALDGLIVVDLAKADPRVVERYMPKKVAANERE